MKRSAKTTYILLTLAVAALCPLIVGKFNTYLLTEVMIFSIFGASLYLLFGHTGLLSFGHAAYFGVGAYTTALCLLHLPGLPLLFALFIGGASGLLAGLLIGSMLLRLQKIYFSFGTLAFSQMIWAIAWKWRSVTGGDDGLTGWSSRMVDIPLVGQFALRNVSFLYYLVFSVAAICILLCWFYEDTTRKHTRQYQVKPKQGKFPRYQYRPCQIGALQFFRFDSRCIRKPVYSIQEYSNTQFSRYVYVFSCRADIRHWRLR
jgi:ABC-type branched-subunit amino acid transport system permease subunit